MFNMHTILASQTMGVFYFETFQRFRLTYVMFYLEGNGFNQPSKTSSTFT